MRFEDLFDDLAAQGRAAEDRVLWDEAQELARAELAGRSLAARVGVGARVRVWLSGGHVLTGVVTRAGRDAMSLDTGSGQFLVPHRALRRVALGRGGAGGGSEDVPMVRLLRALARSRTVLAVALEDGTTLHGRLLGCALDHLELAQESGTVLIATEAVAAVMVTGPSTGE